MKTLRFADNAIPGKTVTRNRTDGIIKVTLTFNSAAADSHNLQVDKLCIVCVNITGWQRGRSFCKVHVYNSGIFAHEMIPLYIRANGQQDIGGR